MHQGILARFRWEVFVSFQFLSFAKPRWGVSEKTVGTNKRNDQVHRQ
jgi:hypothetical protein